MRTYAKQAGPAQGRDESVDAENTVRTAGERIKATQKTYEEIMEKYNKKHDKYRDEIPRRIESVFKSDSDLKDPRHKNAVIWSEALAPNLGVPRDRSHLVLTPPRNASQIPHPFEVVEAHGKAFGTPNSSLYRRVDPMFNADRLPEPCKPLIAGLAPNYVADDNEMGACRRFLIHRPEAMNSMDINLARNLRILFQQYDLNDSLTSFMCHTSSHGSYFCSGHDLTRLQEEGPSSQYAKDYFREVYQLATVVQSIKRPAMIMMDGSTYSGPGVALGLFGQFRFTTDFTVFSLPDCQVGFFPDCGAAYFMAQLPSNIGAYLMLTGRRIGAGDMHLLGLANFHAPGLGYIEQLQRVMKDLWYDNDTERFMQLFGYQVHKVPTENTLEPLIPAIERCFGHNTVPEIIRALEEEGTEWARHTANKMRNACPISLCVTLEHLKRVRDQEMPLEEVLKVDYRLALKFTSHPDFFAGVNARIVKGKRYSKPWVHKSVEDVTQEDVNMFFTPLKDTPDVTFVESRRDEETPDWEQIVADWQELHTHKDLKLDWLDENDNVYMSKVSNYLKAFLPNCK